MPDQLDYTVHGDNLAIGRVYKDPARWSIKPNNRAPMIEGFKAAAQA
jgi:hypothetical protein